MINNKYYASAINHRNKSSCTQNRHNSFWHPLQSYVTISVLCCVRYGLCSVLGWPFREITPVPLESLRTHVPSTEIPPRCLHKEPTQSGLPLLVLATLSTVTVTGPPVPPSDRHLSYDFLDFHFFHTHRDTSTLTRELPVVPPFEGRSMLQRSSINFSVTDTCPLQSSTWIVEESDQFRFLWSDPLSNLKSVGLILCNVSTMRVSIPLDFPPCSD